MFDTGLDNIEELERLEGLEKAAKVERTIASASNVNEFFSDDFLFLVTMHQLNYKTTVEALSSSQGS